MLVGKGHQMNRELVVGVAIATGLVNGGFCAFLAAEKNRSVAGWFVLGFLFSFVALIALSGAPSCPFDRPAEGRERY